MRTHGRYRPSRRFAPGAGCGRTRRRRSPWGRRSGRRRRWPATTWTAARTTSTSASTPPTAAVTKASPSARVRRHDRPGQAVVGALGDDVAADLVERGVGRHHADRRVAEQRAPRRRPDRARGRGGRRRGCRRPRHAGGVHHHQRRHDEVAGPDGGGHQAARAARRRLPGPGRRLPGAHRGRRARRPGPSRPVRPWPRRRPRSPPPARADGGVPTGRSKSPRATTIGTGPAGVGTPSPLLAEPHDPGRGQPERRAARQHDGVQPGDRPGRVEQGGLPGGRGAAPHLARGDGALGQQHHGAAGRRPPVGPVAHPHAGDVGDHDGPPQR